MRANLGERDYFYLRQGPRAANRVPLLLLHGGPGLDHSILRPWMDGLSSQRELIYVDALGCGRSSGQDLLPTHRVAAAVEDLEALRIHLKVERWLVFGHGFGAFEAQAYALQHPSACAGLILCNAAPAFDYPQALITWAQNDCTPAQLAALVQMLTQRMETDAALHQLFGSMLPLYFYRYDPKVGSAMLDSCRFSAAGFNYGLFDMAAQFDMRAELANLKGPILLLGGQHDWLMPPSLGAERLHQTLPHSTLALFEESGHFPFIEEPVVFHNVLKQWIERISPCPKKP
jgi:proline iminopeptidase